MVMRPVVSTSSIGIAATVSVSTTCATVSLDTICIYSGAPAPHFATNRPPTRFRPRRESGTPGVTPRAAVVPTDEEWMIACDTAELAGRTVSAMAESA
jgi:hypothetical protein